MARRRFSSANYAADDPHDPAYGNGTSALVQTGGTITLGTSGTPDGTPNTTYGYQNVTTSGQILVAAGAVLDVSGGPGGTNIDNSGGSVIIRAPILSDNTVNVDFSGTVRGVVDGNGNAIGKGVVLDAYAVWSTMDPSAGAKHFDGIIDPAGWYDAAGNLVTGTFIDPQGVSHVYTPGSMTADQLKAALTNDIFVPDTAATNQDHVGFYQTTLANFVENFSLSNSPFAAGIGNVHLRPEMDLINPSMAINNGNVTLASNWNLGAGSLDASGTVNLVYRTNNGKEPGTVGLFARNNVNINATITDGFFTNYAPTSGGFPDAASQYNAEINSKLYLTYLGMFSNGVLQYDSSGVEGALETQGFSWTAAGMTAPATPISAGPDFFNVSQDVFNSFQFQLQSPAVFTGATAAIIDQYNQYYAEYINLFRDYEAATIMLNTAGNSNLHIPGGAIISSANYDQLYAQFNGAAGLAFLTTSQISIPNAPTLNTPYFNIQTGLGSIQFDSNGLASTSAAEYATQWAAYFISVMDLMYYNATAGGTLPPENQTVDTAAQIFNIQSPFAAIAVAPPYAPPAYTTLQPGFVASPPPATNPPPPADQIANNPAIDSVTGNAVHNTTSAAQLMSAAVSGKGSFSYDIVAGAAFTGSNALSVDPNAVVQNSSLTATVTGNVTIDGHTSYVDALSKNNKGQPLTIDIPTLVRTGTGSITIAAAGNVELLDQVAPGAVYTAGAATTTPDGFNAPAVSAAANSNGLVSTPAWAINGGAVSVTAGGSIIGIEMPTDADGSQTGVTGGGTGQLWSDWYIHYGQSNGTNIPFAACATAGSQACQTAAWINYATFFQGFGALGGGNITLKAGADIVDVGASLPETLVVSGGFTAADPPKVTYYGGGNLRVTAGGNLLSSDFLVGRGSGLIQVGGVVQATTSNPLNQGKPTLGITVSGLNVAGSYALPLLLAVQDGFVTLNARGSVTLGNVFDPASVPLDGAVQTPLRFQPGGNGSNNANAGWSSPFTTYGADSGVALTSLTGDVTAVTLNTGQVSGLFVHNPSVFSASLGKLLPATLEVTAPTGNITVNNNIVPDGSAVGFGNLMTYPTQAGDDTSTLSLVAAGSINLGAGLTMDDGSLGTSPLGVTFLTLTLAPHAHDPNPVIIAAGTDIVATPPGGAGAVTTLTLDKPAEIEAGNDITFGGAFKFTGQNNNATDITSIVAGHDFTGGTYLLYGPGTFLVQAGHDMGPFAQTANGIITVGNGSALGSSSLKPYLPAQGAELDVLFGVKPQITDYAAVIDNYVDPARSGTSGIDLLKIIAGTLGDGTDRTKAWNDFKSLSTAQQRSLVDSALTSYFGTGPHANYMAFITQYLAPGAADIGYDLLSDVASRLEVTRDAAGALFAKIAAGDQSLTTPEKLAIGRAFNDLLIQVGKDAKDSTSAFFGQYARAYAAISTLFPATLGYTDNGTATGNGAAATIPTGKLKIAGSVLETQMGGDINILGPGGGITVGTSSADNLLPNQEGILTLGGGSIRVFTDGSILVNQSRIMTEQGGDIGLFTANGDINAGSGPKTFASSPTVSEICTKAGYCFVNPQGLVTGAGIAALITLPGQDPSKSNVTLVAPHGIIDVGSAGLRGTNITLAALTVLNAFNIQATGTVTGLAFTPQPNVPALTAASTANTATQQTGLPTPTQSSDRPSIIIVEVLGFGGGSGGGVESSPPPNSGDTNKPASDDDRRHRQQP
jgi:hypothetical protein